MGRIQNLVTKSPLLRMCNVTVVKTDKITKLYLLYVKFLFIHFWTSSINISVRECGLWGLSSNVDVRTTVRESRLSLLGGTLV